MIVCVNKGVDNVIIILWGDNGVEVLLFLILFLFVYNGVLKYGY